MSIYEQVVFPDATDLLVTYLDGELTEHVGSRIPNPRPTTFVRVLRTGGPKRNLVTDQPQMTFESWGDDDAEAADLAQQVRSLVNALPGQIVDGVPVYRVDELSGPANLPDPLSSQSRYTQSFAIALRGTASGS